MALVKFACLLLVCICTAGLSLAHSPRDASASTEVHTVSSAKGLQEDETATAACTNRRIKGRKMAVGNDMKLQKENSAVASTSNISSSNHAAENHESEGGKSGTNGRHRQRASRLSEEADEAGFVAFNADYHAPRHHPPKNN